MWDEAFTKTVFTGVRNVEIRRFKGNETVLEDISTKLNNNNNNDKNNKKIS